MERHLSTGVATIVALMAATRTASRRVDIPFDPMEGADFSAEHVAPRDQVGARAFALSVTPGNRRRNSIAADSSPS